MMRSGKAAIFRPYDGPVQHRLAVMMKINKGKS